jgi:hypothetical protein
MLDILQQRQSCWPTLSQLMCLGEGPSCEVGALRADLASSHYEKNSLQKNPKLTMVEAGSELYLR